MAGQLGIDTLRELKAESGLDTQVLLGQIGTGALSTGSGVGDALLLASNGSLIDQTPVNDAMVTAFADLEAKATGGGTLSMVLCFAQNQPRFYPLGTPDPGHNKLDTEFTVVVGTFALSADPVLVDLESRSPPEMWLRTEGHAITMFGPQGSPDDDSSQQPNGVATISVSIEPAEFDLMPSLLSAVHPRSWVEDELYSPRLPIGHVIRHYYDSYSEALRQANAPVDSSYDLVNFYNQVGFTEWLNHPDREQKRQEPGTVAEVEMNDELAVTHAINMREAGITPPVGPVLDAVITDFCERNEGRINRLDAAIKGAAADIVPLQDRIDRLQHTAATAAAKIERLRAQNHLAGTLPHPLPDNDWRL